MIYAILAHRISKQLSKNLHTLRESMDNEIHQSVSTVRESLLLSDAELSHVRVELNKKAAEQLKNNANTLKLDNTNIINTSAIKHLAIENQGDKFNLVFVDPPFRKGLAEPSCHLLEQNDWLADEALIYVEVEKECTFDAPENWQVLKEKQAGQVLCRLYQRN